MSPARRSFIVEPLPPHEAEPGRSGRSGLSTSDAEENCVELSDADHCCSVALLSSVHSEGKCSQQESCGLNSSLHKLQVAPQTLCSRCTFYTFTSVFSPTEKMKERQSLVTNRMWTLCGTNQSSGGGAGLGGGVRGLSESVSRRSLTQSGF